MSVLIEPSPADARFDRWLARFKILIAFTLGIVSGVTTMIVAGDTRYVRRGEFESHSSDQARIEEHAATDRASYATKAELAAHAALTGHSSTVEVNRRQEERIRRLEQNMAWIAKGLYAIARRNSIQLPPPPELRDLSPGNREEEP